MQLIINGVILRGVHKDELKSAIAHLEFHISACREKLMMLGASLPHVVKDIEGNEISWIDYIQKETNELLSELEQYFVEKHLAEVALENLDMVEEKFD